MSFSATDAALEGFKLTRARPVAALVWAGVLLALAVVDQLAAVLIAGKRLSALLSITPLAALSNPEALKPYWGVMAAVTAVNLVLSIIAQSFLFAAAARAVMKPQEGGAGWLAAGVDELRQAAVLALYFLVLFAAYLFGAVLASLLFGVGLTALMGRAGATLALLLSGLADLAFVVWIGVRLSLAPPATFARRRIVLFDTWKLTRGRFWPLLGAYIVSWLLGALVFVLVMFIGTVLISLIGAVTSVAGHGAGHGAEAAAGPASLTNPATLVFLLFSAGASGLTNLILLPPPAVAYRALAGAGEVAETTV